MTEQIYNSTPQATYIIPTLHADFKRRLLDMLKKVFFHTQNNPRLSSLSLDPRSTIYLQESGQCNTRSLIIELQERNKRLKLRSTRSRSLHLFYTPTTRQNYTLCFYLSDIVSNFLKLIFSIMKL